MRKKELFARRVERKHQRVKKPDLNADVTLTGVSSVTPNTKGKELDARRVKRRAQFVISPAEMSGWRGSIKSVPVDALTGESSGQTIRMGTNSVTTPGGHLTVDLKPWRLRSSARHPPVVIVGGKQKKAATENGFARRRNGASRVRFADLWVIPAYMSSTISTRVRRSLTSLKQKQKRRF